MKLPKRENYFPQAFYVTRYFGPTEAHPHGRIRATNVTSRKSVTVRWDHALDVPTNHLRAVRACIDLCDQPQPNNFVVCDTGTGYTATGIYPRRRS